MNNVVDLSHIIGKAQNGDIRSFEEIYNLFVKKIYVFVYQRVGHRESAEDITSDIFIKIYNTLSSYKDNGTFTAWIYTISRYTIADFWREQMKKSTLTLDDEIICENHLKTIEELNRIQPKVIIYISCNPEQLGKELPKFKNYSVKSSALFDMFPQTQHSEAVIELVRNDVDLKS